ncbi:MAG: heme-binding protein [Flavobacteriales bacterium]
MKTLLIIVAIVVVAFVVFQVYTTFSTRKTEAQKYNVVSHEEGLEIRYYPEAVLATVHSSDTSYRDLGYSGFGKLIRYISGNNSRQQKISMTAPVHMNIDDTVSTMAFVMPAGMKYDELPLPNNMEVQLKTAKAEYVAALSFGGFASTERIEEQRMKLEKMLNDREISIYGNFRYFGYNPPYQLFGRKNEVVVSINASSIPK